MKTITPFQFFANLFSEPLETGQLMVWSKIRKSGKTATDWCYDLDQAGRQVERYRRTRDVYFGVALQDKKTALTRARRRMKRAAPSDVRGSEESVTALPALWAEIGVAGAGPGPVGAPPSLAAGRARVPAFLDALPQPPSIVVATGTTLQAYWLLDRLWVLEDPEERRRAKRLLGKIRWALAARVESQTVRSRPGPEADHFHPGLLASAGAAARPDLAGLMRVAGTFQQQGKRRWPIAVVRLPEGGTDRLYAPADFEQLEDPPPATNEPSPWQAAGPGAEPETLDDPEADFRRVWRGCSWIRHCHRQQATLPESEWAAALSIVGRARAGAGSPEVRSPEGGSPEVGGSPTVGSPGGADGRRLAHAFSVGHPGYAPELTDRTLARALAGEAATCRRVGRRLGAWGAHCCRCRHQGRIESPIALGARQSPAAPQGSISTPGLAPATAPAITEAMAPPAMAPPAGAPPAERTADGEEPLFGPIAGEPQIELVIRITPGVSHPWDPLIRAAIARLERSISKRGRRGGSGGDPRSREPEPFPALVEGLGELLATLGGEGTSRQMVEALAAPRNRDRFGLLRAALSELVSGLQDGVPTPRQLGRALASCRDRGAGGRTIVRRRRSRKGMTWAVQRTEGTTVN